MRKSDEYRMRAAEVVRVAAATGDVGNKAALISLANGWIKLARLIEVYGSDRSPLFKAPAKKRSRKGSTPRNRH